MLRVSFDFFAMQQLRQSIEISKDELVGYWYGYEPVGYNDWIYLTIWVMLSNVSENPKLSFRTMALQEKLAKDSRPPELPIVIPFHTHPREHIPRPTTNDMIQLGLPRMEKYHLIFGNTGIPRLFEFPAYAAKRLDSPLVSAQLLLRQWRRGEMAQSFSFDDESAFG